jgi:hypothetical protein
MEINQNSEFNDYVQPTYSKDDPELVIKAGYFRKKPVTRPTLDQLGPGKHYGKRQNYQTNKQIRSQIAMLLQPNKLPPHLARKNRTYLLNLLDSIENKKD